MTTIDNLPTLLADKDYTIKVCNHLGKDCGYMVTLPNKWQVSVQCGFATYSSNHDAHYGSNASIHNATTAEIAAFDPNGDWWEFENDTVKGYQTLSDVLDFIRLIESQ